MTTIHVDEFYSASRFKAGLAHFTYADYESTNLDIGNVDDPYGYLFSCSGNSIRMFHWYEEMLINDAVEKGAHVEVVLEQLTLCHYIVD